MNMIRIIPLLTVLLFFHSRLIQAQYSPDNNTPPFASAGKKTDVTIKSPGQIIIPSQTKLSKMIISEDNKILLTESVKQNWDGEQWIDAWQYAYEYGSNNKVISLTYSTWYETNWNPYWQTLTTYNDTNKKIIEVINQRWDGEHWLPNSKSVMDYDENLEMNEVINYLYDNQWIESSKMLYTYDTTEYINLNNDTIIKTTDQITQLWNGFWVDHEKNSTSYIKMAKKYFPAESVTQTYYLSYWADKSKMLYKYDSLFNLTEHVRQVPGTEDWVNEKRNVYKYDRKNPTEDLYQEWGGTGDDTGWKNVNIHQKTYNADTLLEHVYKEWIGSEWLNISRNLYYYANDTLSEDLFQVWADPEWVNDKLHSYTYDMNKCRTEDLHSRWNGSFWIWWERELFFYSTVTDTEPYEITNIPLILLNNYPNPFISNTTIRYLIPEEGKVSVTIHNSAGVLMKTLVNENQLPGQYEIIFTPHDLSPGIYFYSIRVDNFTETKKMILVR